MKLLRLRIFILLLCCFAGAQALAQTKNITKKDTTIPVDSTRFFRFTENQFDYGNYVFPERLFNRLDGFQDYQPRQASLGNAGAPAKMLSLPEIPNDAFRRGPNYFSYFGYGPYNRQFYTSDRPYTRLVFITGQKQELNVSAVHAHPFGKNCNIAFGFDRIRSTGFYKRQNTNNTSVNLNGWYRAPGRRYAMLADIYWTTFNVAENGGLKNDSSFEFATQLDRQLVTVNLYSATTKQHQRGAWVKQYWAFGPAIDTLSLQTDSTRFKTKIQPSWAIVHTVSIRDEIYQYLDANPASGYYANIYSDSLQTNDSTHLWRMENGLWLEFFDMRQLRSGTDSGSANAWRLFSGKIGVRQEFGELKADTIYQPFSNWFADGELRVATRWNWMPLAKFSGWYAFSGYNLGDYHAKATFGGWLLTLAGETSRLHPALLYTGYSGNHFRWENDFTPSQQSDVRVFLDLPFEKLSLSDHLILSAGYYNYDRPLYFDSTFLPAQYNGSVNAVSANLTLDLGTKRFRTRNNITWNNLPASSPIRLPEWIVRESVYGNFRLFKSALQLQTGVDITWFSAYYADAYNPAVSQFYLQNSEKIGNYAFVDAWLSIKVKPVRVFVKADHINAGLSGRKYYLVPHYPANDFALKFGASWVFND